MGALNHPVNIFPIGLIIQMAVAVEYFHIWIPFLHLSADEQVKGQGAQPDFKCAAISTNR